MPKYACFDPTLSIAPVCGWYDTDAYTYTNLPASTNLLLMTDAQWTARLTGQWAVQNGALIAATPAPPTLAQQAQVALNAGLTIGLSGSITLAPTVFPVDAVTTGKIGAVVTTLLARGEFPNGGTSYPMKDAMGEWHTFDIIQYEAVAGAISTYAASLYLIIDGNPENATELPSASVSLTV